MRSLRTPLLTLLLLGETLWLWFRLIDNSVWQLHHTIGLAIGAPAWLLWARARYDLGDSFTGGAHARALVTRGMYARIRHPIYIFGECVCVGVILFMGRPLQLLLLFAATSPLQVIRARKEERVLEAAFGGQYRAYKKQSWF